MVYPRGCHTSSLMGPRMYRYCPTSIYIYIYMPCTHNIIIYEKRALIIDFRWSPLKNGGSGGIIHDDSRAHRYIPTHYYYYYNKFVGRGRAGSKALINHRDRPSRTTNHFRIKNLFPIQSPPRSIIDNGYIRIRVYTTCTRISARAPYIRRYVTHRWRDHFYFHRFSVSSWVPGDYIRCIIIKYQCTLQAIRRFLKARLNRPNSDSIFYFYLLYAIVARAFRTHD